MTVTSKKKDVRLVSAILRADPAGVKKSMTGRRRSAPEAARAAHRDLMQRRNPVRAALLRRYFKTGPGEYGAGDRFIGLTLPNLRELAGRYQALPLAALRILLQSPWHEERQLALFVLVRQFERGDEPRRKAIASFYLTHTRRVNNWDLVDCSAGPIVGGYLERRGRRLLSRLARSPLVWDRRIALLATSPYIKNGDFADALRVIRLTLDDRHDLVHKAAGWMLREIGKRDRRVEQDFLRRYAGRMPRTMLRYAIERLPERERRRYLAMPRNGSARRHRR
jgi:3-methyladenine DNA glycosylase AlkD